jgi:hypothetical protein
MKKWFKYLLFLCVLIFSTGSAMAQGPYIFSGSNTESQWVNQYGNNGATAALNYTYLTVNLDSGNFLRHLDYSINWKNHGWGSSSAASNAKINLYNNSTFITTLEIIYENNSANANTFHTYTGSLSFNNPISAGYNIKVEINAPNWGLNTWESYINNASITAVTGPLCETLIFEDDFQTSPISPEWSITSGVLPVLFSYNSTQVFGPFGNKTINLDLTGLPTHTYIRVEFDLYIFDSWDGNDANDEWKLKTDGVDRIHTDFDNHTWWSAPQNMQSYPHNVEFSNPVQTGSVQSGLPNRCWSGNASTGSTNCTSKYLINNITQHTGTSLTIGLQGLGLNSGTCDESWGIDNVKVYALGIYGCTNPLATNYDANAICDDGSCITCVYGCTDPTACNYDPLATCDDGSCVGLSGCTDVTACNYNVLATCDDGSCILPDGCTDPLACNYDAVNLCDDGSCVYDLGTIVNTSTCSGLCDGQIDVLISVLDPNYDPNAVYTYAFDGNPAQPYNTTINTALCSGSYNYEFFIDGISCGVETIIIGEYPAMTLQTTAVDSTCDSSHAFVSASVASSSGGNISSLTYCTSEPALNTYSNIELVSLVGDGDSIVNNTSGACDTYEDYTTTHYTTLTPGQSYSIDIDIGDCGGASFIDLGKVFIDWNQNGLFTDPGEEIGGFGGVPSPYSYNIQFPVPTNASYGATRMRVVSQFQSTTPGFPSGPVGPCDVGIFSGSYPQPWYGATEDYSIVISSTATLTNTTYQWYSGVGSTSPIPGATDSITNSLAAGQYTVIVTDANGCEATDIVSVGSSLNNPSLNITPPNPCYGDTITLEAIPNDPTAYEYKFKYKDIQTTAWSNIPYLSSNGFYQGWYSDNPLQYGPIYEDTDFKVKIRWIGGCETNWVPTNSGITVPVNILPSSGPIWHN